MDQDTDKKTKDELGNEQKQERAYVRPELLKRDELSEATGITMVT